MTQSRADSSTAPRSASPWRTASSARRRPARPHPQTPAALPVEQTTDALKQTRRRLRQRGTFREGARDRIIERVPEFGSIAGGCDAYSRERREGNDRGLQDMLEVA